MESEKIEFNIKYDYLLSKSLSQTSQRTDFFNKIPAQSPLREVEMTPKLISDFRNLNELEKFPENKNFLNHSEIILESLKKENFILYEKIAFFERKYESQNTPTQNKAHHASFEKHEKYFKNKEVDFSDFSLNKQAMVEKDGENLTEELDIQSSSNPEREKQDKKWCFECKTLEIKRKNINLILEKTFINSSLMVEIQGKLTNISSMTMKNLKFNIFAKDGRFCSILFNIFFY